MEPKKEARERYCLKQSDRIDLMSYLFKPGLSVPSHNTSNSGGVAILFSDFYSHFLSGGGNSEGQTFKSQSQSQSNFFVFLCVYAPTIATDRIGFLNTLDNSICSCECEDILLLGGDFNCTELTIARNHVEPNMPSHRHRVIELLLLN